MSFTAQRIYELLPAVYRIRDAENAASSALLLPAGATEEARRKLEKGSAGPLKALLWVMAEQVAVLEENLAQFYDDQFIETCAEWVVPYIADLLGHPIQENVDDRISLRAEVANTIAYRRRKGTVAVLEQLARDTTGWGSRAVEFFQLLGCTQHLNHVRQNAAAAPDLRNWEPLERVDTPFDSLAHTVDVRGRYNAANVGIFLWRLQSYFQEESPACHSETAPHPDHCFHFHPLGHDTQLFTNPETEDTLSHLATPIHVPMAISRVVLRHQLDRYYGKGRSLHIELHEAGARDPYRSLPIEKIEVCDLSRWECRLRSGQVAIDPVLGRMAFGTAQRTPPRVSFHYGFSADVGGGDYERAATFESQNRPPDRPIREVPKQYHKIQDALDATLDGGCIKICSNQRFAEPLTITVVPGARLELRAVNGCRPSLVGRLQVKGGDDSEVTLNGLLIQGTLNLKNSSMRRLRLRHCTLVPGSEPSLIIDDPNIAIELDHCIVGGLEINAAAKLDITDSIVDGSDSDRWALAGSHATTANTTLYICRSTVLGRVHVHTLELAENTIFQDVIIAAQQQAGCMRFCYAPFNSQTPRRFRCVPDVARTADLPDHPPTQDNSATSRPQFEDTRYGQPNYCQLARHCPDAIRRGADDHAEMGVFHHLYQPQREDAFQAYLQRYARLGMTTHLYYVT